MKSGRLSQGRNAYSTDLFSGQIQLTAIVQLQAGEMDYKLMAVAL